MTWFYWFSNNHPSMETMTVFFKREDEEIKEKTKQKHNSKHPVFPSLNTSSLTPLLPPYAQSVKTHRFVFPFSLDRLLLRDRVDAKILQVATFWAKAEKKEARLLSGIFRFFLREASLWPQNRLRTFLSGEPQRADLDWKIKIKTTFSIQKSRNGCF